MYFQVENRNCVQLRWRKSCPSSCEIIHHTLRNMKRMIRIRNPALTLEEGALILYSLSLFFWKLLFITLRGLLLLSLLSAAVAKNASASFPFSSRILGQGPFFLLLLLPPAQQQLLILLIKVFLSSSGARRAEQEEAYLEFHFSSFFRRILERCFCPSTLTRSFHITLRMSLISIAAIASTNFPLTCN